MDFNNPLDVWLLDKATRNSNNEGPDGCALILCMLCLSIPVLLELGFICVILYNIAEHINHGDLLSSYGSLGVLAFLVAIVALYLWVHTLAMSRRWLRIGLYVFFVLIWTLVATRMCDDMFYQDALREHWDTFHRHLYQLLFSFGVGCFTLVFRIPYMSFLRRRFAR